jgi:hypothetical protein
MSNSPVSATERIKQVKLTMKGLENTASLGISDFTLRLRGQKVECSRFEAAFISPRITAILLQDPTIDEYEIEFELDSAQEFDSECVKSLISLARNGSFEVTESNFDFVKRIATSLGNSELCESLGEFISEGGAVDASNVVERLSLYEVLGVSRSNELDYLSSHLYELEGTVLKGLSHEHLKTVFESQQLHISSEDWLLDFILELGSDYFDLLGCVRTEYLSQPAMSRLLDSISREEFDDELWKSLCRRLLLFVPSNPLPDSRFVGVGFPLDPSQPFKGIISHLSAECGGNVHTHGIVSITASSTCRNACHQVVDYDWKNYWCTDNVANSWIQFDFKSRRISPTHYTIRSDGSGYNHLLTWSLDGSNDGTSWTPLDRRDTNDLNGNYVVKSYDCQSNQSPSSGFRFVRLTQTGADSSGSNYLLLGNLEFFGKMKESESS